MKRHLNRCLAMAAVGLFANAGFFAVTATASAPPPQAPAEQSTPVLLRVQFTIDRLEGETVVSSTPFEVLVRANASGATASLNHGMDVAVPQSTKDGTTSYTYRRVGTNVTVSNAVLGDGVVSFQFSVELSSVESEPDVTPVPTVFPSFQVTEHVFLRPGETLSAALGTDRKTQETYRLSVRADLVR